MAKSLREHLIRQLASGEFVSGEVLGKEIGVSRAAVSKHINALAEMGLDIFRHVIWTSFVGSKKAKIAATGLRPPHERAKDLQLLKELMEENIIKPVIDRSYPLTQISEAHRYVDTGRKRGNVVINIVNN